MFRNALLQTVDEPQGEEGCVGYFKILLKCVKICQGYDRGCVWAGLLPDSLLERKCSSKMKDQTRAEKLAADKMTI